MCCRYKLYLLWCIICHKTATMCIIEEDYFTVCLETRLITHAPRVAINFPKLPSSDDVSTEQLEVQL